jgi:hypothetical protein
MRTAAGNCHRASNYVCDDVINFAAVRSTAEVMRRP